jgi:hypothetical protein
MWLYIKTNNFIPLQIKKMASFEEKSFDTDMVHTNHMWIAPIHQSIDKSNTNEAVGKNNDGTSTIWNTNI